MSTAVVLDSNSGLTKEEARELGMYILPMPFMIDGKEYLDGKDITYDEFLRLQKNGADIVTSQPSPEDVMDLWTELLKEYDSIIHIPMSAGLDAIEMLKEGMSPEKIKEKLEADAGKSGIYLMVSDLKYLKKGGRITPMAAALASLLKIKPVLQIHESKIDAYGKARTFKQAKQIMLEALKKDLAERLDDPDAKNSRVMIAQYDALDFANEFAAELEPVFGKVDIVNLSLSVATHIGPGTVAVAAARKSSNN